jgi:hypothetical protein
MTRVWYHLITSWMVAHNMSRMATMPSRTKMKDLLLMSTVMLRVVQPSFAARKIHVNRMRLCGHGTRGSSATKVARLVVWVLLLVVGRILVPMVLLQEGAVGEQRLGVAVRCDGRHQLQAEVAFHHLVEAPIPNPQAAVAVHLGSSSSKQIQMPGQDRRKSDGEKWIFLRFGSAHLHPRHGRQSLKPHFRRYCRLEEFKAPGHFLTKP